MIYKNILVPIDGSLVSEELLRFICSIETVIPGQIYAVYVLEVPRNLPLSEAPADKMREAYEIINHAERIAEEYGALINTQIIYARTLEDSILATAADLKCDTIAIAQNNQKMKLFTNTAMNIYQRAKCSVWLINLR